MQGTNSSFELISFLMGRELRPKLACEIRNVRMVNEIVIYWQHAAETVLCPLIYHPTKRIFLQQ